MENDSPQNANPQPPFPYLEKEAQATPTPPAPKTAWTTHVACDDHGVMRIVRLDIDGNPVP